MTAGSHSFGYGKIEQGGWRVAWCSKDAHLETETQNVKMREKAGDPQSTFRACVPCPSY